MSNTNLLSMSKQFSGLPMESLIGAPLNAAAKANAMMAQTQIGFLMDTCFQPASGGTAEKGPYEPIMISMQITKQTIPETVSDGKVSLGTPESLTTTFKLPILTILPLNSLAVQSAQVTFDMQVKSSYDESTSHNTSSSFSGKGKFSATIGIGPFSATVSGSVSYSQKDSTTHDTHYSKSNSASYSVDVKAGQIPLPKGVTTIIDAYTKAINPIILRSTSTSNQTPPS